MDTVPKKPRPSSKSSGKSQAFPEHAWQSAGRIIYRINVNFSPVRGIAGGELRQRVADPKSMKRAKSNLQGQKYNALGLRMPKRLLPSTAFSALRSRINRRETRSKCKTVAVGLSPRIFFSLTALGRNSLHRKWFRWRPCSLNNEPVVQRRDGECTRRRRASF